jgi:hypothetical protein
MPQRPRVDDGYARVAISAETSLVIQSILATFFACREWRVF